MPDQMTPKERWLAALRMEPARCEQFANTGDGLHGDRIPRWQRQGVEGSRALGRARHIIVDKTLVYYYLCKPHSLRSGDSHHHRPARTSSPGSMALVHGAQPMLGKFLSWSLL